eukprot:CAMPEP_0184487208 /NCGR_PEP_ID=MMETSP0113_2-20130426/9486_1 /TAXON_ID=91329 /ORGANISM="Norrisiella sphaerica, Strain BC52" /LENGTH=152 /DNA_ID=CAMNT_0026869421 /DNA_START=104 /DNA_END=562 /DNA_ORIENTATION=+
MRPIQKHFSGKTLVGTDKYGNRYVIFEPTKDSPPRRMVDFKGGVYEPDQIHKLWSMWLSHTRDDPPTQEEMEVYDREMDDLAERVKEVEAEDAKKRMQEQLERHISEDTKTNNADINIAGMFEAINKEGEKSSQGGGGGGGGKFQPKGWTPK